MKFSWFHLMPWPHLPEDFREKYRSVWVDVPSDLYDPVAGHFLYHFYNRCLHVPGAFAAPPGYTTLETMKRGIRSQLDEVSAAAAKDLTWKDIVDRGYVIAGSAETVTDRLREVATELNVGHQMVLCQFGSMPREVAYENTERFAADVIPKLRDLHSGWEDRWWPNQTLDPLAVPGAVEQTERR